MNPEQEKAQMQRLLETQAIHAQIRQNKLGHMAVKPSSAMIDRMEEKESKFELPTNQVKPNDIKTLNKDFDDIYGSENRNDSVYSFSSDKDAIQFFQQQAQLGRSFLVKKAGEDAYMYSDGKGNFFKGTQDELQDYLQSQTDTAYQATNVTPLGTKPQPSSSNTSKEEEEEEQMTLGM